MTAGTIHVIGAGLAGLSAAVRLAERGRRVLRVHLGGEVTQGLAKLKAAVRDVLMKLGR